MLEHPLVQNRIEAAVLERKVHCIGSDDTTAVQSGVVGRDQRQGLGRGINSDHSVPEIAQVCRISAGASTDLENPGRHTEVPGQDLDDPWAGRVDIFEARLGRPEAIPGVGGATSQLRRLAPTGRPRTEACLRE